MAFEPHGEARRSGQGQGRARRLLRAAWPVRDVPAGERGGRLSRLGPQDEGRHSACLLPQFQPAAGREAVKTLAPARQHEHGTERGAGYRLLARPELLFLRAQADGEDLGRIEPHRAEPRAVKKAALLHLPRLAKDEKRLAPQTAGQGGRREGKADGRPGSARTLADHLMQPMREQALIPPGFRPSLCFPRGCITKSCLGFEFGPQLLQDAPFCVDR